MLLRLWRIGTILLVALLQGLTFAHLLERPAKLQYDAAFYIKRQQTLYVQWGPPNFGGILEPATILVTVILAAFLLRKHRPALWFTTAAAGALLLAFPVMFFWLVAPANEVFLAAGPDRIPADWMDMRAQWETGHAVRFLLQFIALGLLVISLAFETRNATRGSRGA